MHPVVRAAFKAVEPLLKWRVGSTPTSTAVIFNKMLYKFERYFDPLCPFGLSRYDEGFLVM